MSDRKEAAPAAHASGRAEVEGDVKELRAGDEIAGKYRLSRLLGAGGMGAVWAAHNEVLDIDVAIKFLRVSEATRGFERFQQEARAAAGLGHASIVRVLDFGRTDAGAPFLVMEFLDGLSVADLLDVHTRLAPQEAVQLILPLCSALEMVHRKGIVHRDLKPDNIMVVASGQGHRLPKLVDFGIVKLLDPIDSSARPLTMDGSVVGTPDYMSPEQARGRLDVDARSDIWSLSVVLYEMITGRRPFRADNYLALLQAIIDDVPTPLRDLAAGDQELWAILQQGLAKEATDRWQTMRELGRALAEWCLARGVETDSTGASLAAHWLRTSTAPPRSLSQQSIVDKDLRRELAGSSPTLEEPLHSRATAPPIERPARAPSQRPRRMNPGFLAAGLAGLAALAGLWIWFDQTRLAAHDAPSSAAAPPPAPPPLSAALPSLPDPRIVPPASAAASAPPVASAPPAVSARAAIPTVATAPAGTSTAAPASGKKPARTPAGKSTGVGDMPLPTSPTF